MSTADSKNMLQYMLNECKTYTALKWYQKPKWCLHCFSGE